VLVTGREDARNSPGVYATATSEMSLVYGIASITWCACLDVSRRTDVRKLLKRKQRVSREDARYVDVFRAR